MLLTIRYYLESHRSALHQTIQNIKASPLVTLLSVALITIALSLPGILLVVLQNTQGLVAGLEQPASISAYVKPQASDTAINELNNEISAMTGVAKIQIIDAQDALIYFQKHYGMEQSLALFDQNPFPAVIEISVTPEYSRGMALDTLLFNLERQNNIERVETNIIWLERMDALITLISTFVWLLTILFIAAAILMISTLMLAEITKRVEEIKILMLLGATPIFIRRPFLYRAWAYGLMSGVGATVTIVIVSTLMHVKLQKLIMLYHGGKLAELDYFMISAATLIATIIICLSGTAIALAKQKKKLL